MNHISSPSKQYVGTGSYTISESKGLSLEACLGTCVGVTLCDRSSNLGGLLHLLLPEPVDANKPWPPERYASTGLPLFIRALEEAGASKENLKACIAGGALVGPLSREDLELDIGGRTAEVTRGILSQMGIPVVKSETGGYFSCRITLDLRNWETHIEPIGSPTSTLKREFKKPDSENIERAIRCVRPIPQTALKIVRMIHDEDYNMDMVAEEVRKDQVISAKVLNLCNSSLIGLRHKIDSIGRALVILGEKRLLKLVVSASLELFFAQSAQGYSLCKGGLYQHALGTAIVAEELANQSNDVPGDIAYTAGLLHDIGKVVLDQYVATSYPFFYRQTQLEEQDMTAVEQDLIGIPHTEVGGKLADGLCLADNLRDVIVHHHYPEKASVSPTLTHLVYLADLLMSRFRVNLELENINTDLFALRLQKLGITLAQFPKIIDLMPRTVLLS